VRRQWPKFIVAAIALYVIGPTVTIETGAPARYVQVPVRTPCATYPFGGITVDPFCRDNGPNPSYISATSASVAIYTTHPALRLLSWTDGESVKGFGFCEAPGSGCR